MLYELLATVSFLVSDDLFFAEAIMRHPKLKILLSDVLDGLYHSK